MIRELRHVFHQLFDEGSPLDIGDGLPHAVDIEIPQGRRHLFEPSGQLVELQVTLAASTPIRTAM